MDKVVEWDKKRETLKRLCGGGTVQQICEKIWGDKDFPQNILTSFGKFGKHPPTDPNFKEFFRKMARFLGCKPEIGEAEMISCKHEEFVRLMSVAKRAVLKRFDGSSSHVRFFVDLDANRADVHRDWLRNKAVDQRYMYQDREAVDGWNAVVRSGTYAQYINCKRVLDDFLVGEKWKAFVASGKLGSIVILGAGASEKDTAILNNVLDSGKYAEDGFKFVVVDSSFYMLSDTIDAIEGILKKRKAVDVVDLIPCCADFLRLGTWRDEVRPIDDDKKIAIFILGGTIGNVDEGALFEAIRNVTDTGDLFIVSGEFQPDGDVADYLAELKEVYDQDDTRDVALGAVRTLLDEEGHERDVISRRGAVDVEIVTDTTDLPNHIRSIIPKTVAAVFRLNVPVQGVYLTLVASKRYPESDFEKAVKGFDCVERHNVSKKAPLHKYLVFQHK